MFYFCRRGSNLSLLLDVSSLGSEPVCSVSTPKEVWLQLLHTSSRPLTHATLQQAARDTNTLNMEYQVTTTGLMFVLLENFLEHLLFLNAPVSCVCVDTEVCVWDEASLFTCSTPPCLLHRRSPWTLWAQRSSMSLDTWSKTDTKPSFPVSSCIKKKTQCMLLFSSSLSSWFVVYCLDPESRVILRSPEEEAGPDRYINANYIRVRASHCYLKLRYSDDSETQMSQVTCGSLKVFLPFRTERCPPSGGHIEKLYVDMID